MSEKSDLEAAIAALETQRAVLSDVVVEAALGPMQEKLAALATANTPALPTEDGERKLVTMIFADLSGSTALGEVMDPEEIREMLNGCFDRLVPAVKRFGGTIDKFIGDNVMALFGAPVAHENDPERALRAALGMMEALAEFNSDMGVDLGIHVGVNSGLVIAGGVGSEGERRYSVLGDAVNVAARLEGASETGEILVGPDTRRLAGPAFDYVDLDPISVKGREEPVAVSRLVGVKAGSHSGRGIAGLSSPMVGRDDEFEMFRKFLDDVADGRGGVVSVVADAGVGKSRFVAEARAASREVRWVEGRALAHTTRVPYALAADLMRDLIGADPEAGLGDVSADLAGHLAFTMPEGGRKEWPFLARLLDLPLNDEAAEVIGQFDGSPELLQSRTADAFTRLVAGSASSPLVVVFEDLHWVDESSLGLLEQLVPLVAELPLLLVLLFRHGDSPVSPLHGRLVADVDGYVVIELVPLSRDDAESLVDGLLRIDNLSDETRELIVGKAEGNPLFLEEVLRALIDAGVILVEGDRAVATEALDGLEAIDIPDTVHGVISARIDRLPDGRKATLQAASVIGRVFQRRVLARLIEADAGFNDDLDELRRLGFIDTNDDTGTARFAEYLFKHVFTQEAAYNGMLLARRREFHATVAASIEVLFPDRVEELAATLAMHYENAGQPDKAVPNLLKAAERAAANYANDDALNLTTRGLDLAPEDRPDLAKGLHLVRERVCNVTGDREMQLADLQRLEDLAGETGNDELLLEVLLRSTERDEAVGDPSRMIERAAQAEELGSRIGAQTGVARALLAGGWGRMRLSRIDQAADLLERALRIAADESNAELEITALRYLGSVAFGRRDFAEAIRLGERALELAEANGQLLLEINLHQNLGVSALPTCDFEFSRRHFEAGLDLAQDVGYLPAVVACMFGLAEVLFFGGDHETALGHTDQALAIARETDSVFWVGATLRARGALLTALGRLDEAVAAAEESVDVRRSIGNTPHLMDSLSVLIRANAARDGEEAAMEVAGEAVQYLLDGGSLDGGEYPFRVYWSCLEALHVVGDPRFNDLLRQASELYVDRYPDGGCLPWHLELQGLLASASR